LGAGVGARLNLAFELNICPECGWRLVEHNGLLVCEGCGLVLAPVYEPPKFKPADNSFNGSNSFNARARTERRQRKNRKLLKAKRKVKRRVKMR
jgi:uncharacterized Zn finger protein (UPF0148 family)